ncbi:hypothetical protein XaC1_316 [Xanthomonas phage XaC1]|nr:hypothetical protein XaC1_316 [Xanthomonas phage XaC1]
MQESKQLKYSNNQAGRFDPDRIQIGVVKDNRDPDNSGKLKVWISGSQSNEGTKESWITCRYVSIFAGRTDGEENASTFQEYPKSYGFWAVPPNVGSQVCVFFANGNIHDAYWFGGVFDDRMNAMVPGMATKVVSSSGVDSAIPVTDYDRNSLETVVEEKYVNSPVIDGLKKQNLLYDLNNGAVNRSSTRQTIPTVYGMSSPRQNSIVIDDGWLDDELKATNWDQDEGYQDTKLNNPSDDTRVGSRKDEGICLRTRSGAQILLSESNGNVFIINRDGTGRVEITPEGYINIHADNSINIRTEADMNYYIAKDFNIELGGNLNLKVGGDSKLDLAGKLDAKVGSEVVINTGASLRLYASADLRFQSGASSNITAGSTLNLLSTDVTNAKASAIQLTGAGTHLTIKSDVSTNAIYKGQDFQAGSVGLVNHIHYHAAFTSPTNHSDAMAAPVQGGGSSNAAPAESAQPANDVQPVVPVQKAQESVQVVNTTPEVSQALEQDMFYDTEGSGITYYQTYESLGMVMPCTGTIRQYGYWGQNVDNGDGTKSNRNGWIIQCKGDIVAPEAGTVATIEGGFYIMHKNGFKSVFYDAKLTSYNGDSVTKGQKVATGNGIFYFEIRQSNSALFGFGGTIDPGLFYSTVTGKGSDCANKQLQAGERSNKDAKPVASNDPSINSTDLVNILSVQTIGSGYAQRGSRRTPTRLTANTTKAVKGSAVNFQINDNVSIDKTVVDWKVSNDDSLLISDLKGFEGFGNAINGRSYPYVDAFGHSVGFGHFIKPGEDFSNGLTMDEAVQYLMQDVKIAITGAKKIYASYNMKTPYMIQLVLTEMVYQMGLGSVRKFTGTLSAMARGDYRAAASGMRNSAWYQQTTRRAETLIRRVEACA